MSYSEKQVLMTEKELKEYGESLDVFIDLQSDEKIDRKQRKTAISDTLKAKAGSAKKRGLK